MGFRCPDKGRLRKPILIVDSSSPLVPFSKSDRSSPSLTEKGVVSATTRYEWALFPGVGRSF
jgi:hypothetical protein